MSDIEYSVITSDVIKSFDCTLEQNSQNTGHVSQTEEGVSSS